MPLGGFGLISLFYLVMGVHFATQFWPRRKQIFDSNYTAEDRSMVTRAAFFFLIPVSVLLHEFGHAIVIKLFGGDVLDYGFYFFAGFVSYDPRGFTDTQQMLVAFGGTFVNMVLIVLSLWLALIRKPQLSAPWNELLVQFALISGLNALIAYPLLDFAWGVNGDWSQMYGGDVPWLTGIIVLLQAGFIALGVYLLRNPKAQALIASRTAGTGGTRFSFAGQRQNRPAKTAQQPTSASLSPDEQTMVDAARRVASGWPSRIDTKMMQHPKSTILAMHWESGGANRVVFVDQQAGGATHIRSMAQPAGSSAPPRDAKTLNQWDRMPNVDELTMQLRIALESTEQQPVDDGVISG